MVDVEVVGALIATYAVFAGYLTVTAHVAARNVLGDVPLERALLVGPLTALVPFLLRPIGIFPIVIAAAAVAVDFAAVGRAYDLDTRLAGYVTLIHAIVSVILAAVLTGIVILATTAPV